MGGWLQYIPFTSYFFFYARLTYRLVYYLSCYRHPLSVPDEWQDSHETLRASDATITTNHAVFYTLYLLSLLNNFDTYAICQYMNY